MLDRHQIRLSALDGEGPLVQGEATLFVAPVGTPPPTLAALADRDGPWQLLHPAVPDYPPDPAG